jgi:hypothetical protein
MKEALMRKTAVIIVGLCSFAFGQSDLKTAIYGGGGLMVSAVSQGMVAAPSDIINGTNPGLCAGYEALKPIIPNFGIGGHIEYSWFTLTDTSPYRIGFHFWDLAVVPRAYLPLGEKMAFGLECDPGFSGIYAYMAAQGDRIGAFDPAFGLTTGVTFSVKLFQVAFKLKNVWFKDGALGWLTMTVGYGAL